MHTKPHKLPHITKSTIGLDSGFQVLDSGFFVSGTWILNSNHDKDSGFPWLNSGFQSPEIF